MRGFPTMRGSCLVERRQDCAEDAPAVARLREAGAVILGKTTTPEFGWKALGDSPLTGITRNPWDLGTHAGRQQRRGRRGVCGRDRAAACRQRRRRLDPHSQRLLRGFRAQAELWPGAGLSALADGPAVACRADRTECCRRGADAECAEPRPIRAIPTRCRPKTGIISTASKRACAAGGSPTARPSAMPGSIPKSRRRSPPRCGSSRRSGRMVDEVERDLYLAARSAADAVGGRGGVRRRRLSGRAAEIARPRPRGVRRPRRAHPCGRLCRRRCRPHGARPADDGIPPKIRPAADADDADPGPAGRAGPERPGDRTELARLVAVQLSVQPDAPAGGQHSVRPDDGRVADRPADRRPALRRSTAYCKRPAPSRRRSRSGARRSAKGRHPAPRSEQSSRRCCLLPALQPQRRRPALSAPSFTCRTGRVLFQRSSFCTAATASARTSASGRSN